MKVLKNILWMALVLIVVKSCFFIQSRMVTTDDLLVAGQVGSTQTEREVISQKDSVALRGFRQYALDHGVTVSVPQDWEVLGVESIGAIKDQARAAMGSANDSDTQFAANSHPDPVVRYAQYRISFVAKDITQDDLRAASQQDMDAGCLEVAEGWRQTPSGITFIGEPECKIVVFNDSLALSVKYQREGLQGSVWTVNMLQIPLQDVMVIITTSANSANPEADEVIRQISSHLTF